MLLDTCDKFGREPCDTLARANGACRPHQQRLGEMRESSDIPKPAVLWVHSLMSPWALGYRCLYSLSTAPCLRNEVYVDGAPSTRPSFFRPEVVRTLLPYPFLPPPEFALVLDRPAGNRRTDRCAPPPPPRESGRSFVPSRGLRRPARCAVPMCRKIRASAVS